jgi:LuxR family maltose regulon positive regulatory protein
LHTALLPESLPDSLTAREREIALLAAKGLKNSEIAEKLIVTENTVRTHLHAVFQKLDIDKRTKLAEKMLLL